VRHKGWMVLVVVWTLGPAIPADGYDPNRTITVYVHGFEFAGADRHGVYGEDLRAPLMESIASLVGLPVADETDPLPSNVVVGATYYGDTPPSYYSPADVAEIDQITAEWGGGVPRYALVVAKHAQHILERSGAQQVNFVSVSFGSLIVRWLIEKDVGGLASSGKIARWLTAEGLLCGNWAASRDELVGFLDFLQPLPIDVEHMSYDWVETHLHAPRTEADNPLYAGILIGQVASTDDRFNNGALSALMATYGEYQPNDGVQALGDATFHTVSAPSRLLGMPPTLSTFYSDHNGLAGYRGAWAQAASFITQRRRVTVVMTSAQVSDLHERQLPFWDWRPAEIVFESRVYSPAVAARWAIGDPLSTVEKEGAAAPLRRYSHNGETQSFTQVVFDDLVLSEETELRLDLHGEEIDYDTRYGVYETVSTPYYDDLGAGTLVISTLEPGTYAFHAASWSCVLSVSILDYPFALLTGVSDPMPARDLGTLTIEPNPHFSAVRIVVAGVNGSAPLGVATLSVYDLSGRQVRRETGDANVGFVWDGRDDHGFPLPTGVYLYRVVTPQRAWFGKSCLVR